MRGLEENLEHEEDSVEFQRRVALNISLIVIATVQLIKDIKNYVDNKPFNTDNN